MSPRRLLLLAMALALSLIAGQVSAADLIVERAYFEDPGGSMGLDEVRGAPFLQAGRVVNRGFTRNTLWLRLTVRPTTTGLPLVLNLLPAMLGEVTLFLPGLPGAAAAPGIELTPARLWWHQWTPGEPGVQVLYLKIRSTGAMMLSAEVATETDATDEQGRRRILMGAVLGCLMPILMFVLVMLSTRRDPLYLCLLLAFVSSALIYLLTFGHLHDFAPSLIWLSGENALHLAALGNVLGVILTLHLMLSRTRMPRWGSRLGALCIGCLVTLVVVSVAADAQWVRKSTILVGMAGGLLYAAMALAALPARGGRSRLVSALALAISLQVVQTCGQRLGLLSAGDWSLRVIAWRFMAAPAVFSLVVWLIESDRRSKMDLALAQAASARQSVIDEQARRSLQERLVTTLMHEIKTPLSTIQLAAASLRRGPPDGQAFGARLNSINGSIDDINGIVERYVQMDQFEQGATSFRREAFALQDLIGDVRHSLGDDNTVVRGDQTLKVRADYQGARVILLNLLGNAIKYSPPGASVGCFIESAAREGRPGVQLGVTNEVGVAGIPDPDGVFSRYYRSEGARRVSGAGLGLWLSRETARAMETEIIFDTFDGRVRFILWLESA